MEVEERHRLHQGVIPHQKGAAWLAAEHLRCLAPDAQPVSDLRDKIPLWGDPVESHAEDSETLHLKRVGRGQ